MIINYRRFKYRFRSVYSVKLYSFFLSFSVLLALFRGNTRFECKFSLGTGRALSVECLRVLKIKSDLDKTSLRPPSAYACCTRAPIEIHITLLFYIRSVPRGLRTRKRVREREMLFERQRATNMFSSATFSKVFHDFHDFFPR